MGASLPDGFESDTDTFVTAGSVAAIAITVALARSPERPCLLAGNILGRHRADNIDIVSDVSAIRLATARRCEGEHGSEGEWQQKRDGDSAPFHGDRHSHKSPAIQADCPKAGLLETPLSPSEPLSSAAAGLLAAASASLIGLASRIVFGITARDGTESEGRERVPLHGKPL